MNTFQTLKKKYFWKILASFSFLLAVCFLYAYRTKQHFKQNSSNSNLDNAIEKLSEKGYFIIGSGSCGYCTKQLQELGNNVNKIKFYDCNIDDTMCIKYNIDGFPTWVSPDGTLDPGYKSEDQLIEMANLI